MRVIVEESILQEKVCWWLLYSATKPEVIENMICEVTDCLKSSLSSGMTAGGHGCRSVSWGSTEAVPLLYLVHWPSSPTYRVEHKLQNILDSHL